MKTVKLKRVYKPRKVAAPYLCRLKVLGLWHEASGASAEEAVSTLSFRGASRGPAVVQLSHGDRIKEKILPPLQVLKLFNGSRIVREVALKYLLAVFADI